MPNYLPQKYQDVARDLIPFSGQQTEEAEHIALIHIEPSLPCFLCGQPAENALLSPAPAQLFAHPVAAWLTYPICAACQKRQIPLE